MTVNGISIDTYKPAMAAALSAGYLAVYPHRPAMAASLDAHLRAILHLDGFVWVITVEGEPVGLASVAPLPGLPGQFELDGFIAPAWQRQGLGSQLWQRLREKLPGTAVRQLSHAVTDQQGAAAQFLRQQQFVVAHEEWLLVKPTLADCLRPSHPELTWGTLSRVQAIAEFCRLYDQSFQGLPWYQPYHQHEVSADLIAARDLLFLRREDDLIGFAWLRWPRAGLGQIEPMGIIAAAQGKGYGRYLLNLALYHLAERRARRAQIGVWAENETAVALYQSAGFHHQETITYLAFTI